MSGDSKNCPIGTYCDDFECELKHPEGRWVACENYLDCKDPDCLSRHNRNNDKPCNDYKDTNECKRENCRYSHDLDIINWWRGWDKFKIETRAKKSQQAAESKKSPPATSSAEVCRYYTKGKCKSGDKCKYAHPKNDKAHTLPRAQPRREEVISVSSVPIPQLVLKSKNNGKDGAIIRVVENENADTGVVTEVQKSKENASTAGIIECTTKDGTTFKGTILQIAALKASGVI